MDDRRSPEAPVIPSDIHHCHIVTCVVQSADREVVPVLLLHATSPKLLKEFQLNFV
jgi:hypothetical protein